MNSSIDTVDDWLSTNNYMIQEGDIVKTRGDIGSLTFYIVRVHNEVFCSAKLVLFGWFAIGPNLHFNMNYFDRIKDENGKWLAIR